MTERMKRGGGIAAPLFFCVALITAFASLAWRSHADRTDDLLSLAPKEAVIYVHASRDQARRLLSAAGLGDVGSVLDESAVYATATGTGDLSWGALAELSDSSPDDGLDAPIDAAAGWSPAAGKVIRYGSMPIPVAGASLADRPHVMEALSALRGASLAQAYLRPAASLKLPDAVATPPDEEVVATLRLTADGVTGSMLTLADAAGSGRFGLRLLAQRHTRSAKFVLPDAEIAQYSASPAFDPFELLFASTTTTDTRDLAKDQETVLRAALTGESTFSYSNRLGSALHLPALGFDVLRRAVSDYLAIAWADRVRLTLPDRTRANELKRRLSVPMAGDQDANSVWSVTSGDYRLTVAPDGDSGSILAISPTTSPVALPILDSGCPMSGETSIKLRPLKLGLFSFKELVLSQTVDNQVHFCGYWVENVDNLITERKN